MGRRLVLLLLPLALALADACAPRVDPTDPVEETGELSLTPSAVTLAPGATAVFTATLHEAGEDRDVSAEVTWATGDVAVATVDGRGIATAVAPGATRVRASLGLLSSNAVLTVAAATADGGPGDAGFDAGPGPVDAGGGDAGRDAGPALDAGSDAGGSTDAGFDGGYDAGDPCPAGDLDDAGVCVRDSCLAHLGAGETTTGVYRVQPGNADPRDVVCDMTTAGGGWTVLANNDNADTEPADCVARVATVPGFVCGVPDPTLLSDFALPADGVSFTEVVWLARDDTGVPSAWAGLRYDSAQRSLRGLDDWQDSYGCGDDWAPKARRGDSSLLMVR